MSNVRYTSLIALRDQLRLINISTEAGLQALLAELTYFDPTEEVTLPKFTVVPGPQTIVVDQQGRGRQSRMQVAIIGYVRRLKMAQPSYVASADHADLNGTLFYTIEIVLDAVLDKFVDPAVVSLFADCATGKGFSIAEFGPIIVEEYEAEGEIGYMSINPIIEFIE